MLIRVVSFLTVKLIWLPLELNIQPAWQQRGVVSTPGLRRPLKEGSILRGS